MARCKERGCLACFDKPGKLKRHQKRHDEGITCCLCCKYVITSPALILNAFLLLQIKIIYFELILFCNFSVSFTLSMS